MSGVRTGGEGVQEVQNRRIVQTLRYGSELDQMCMCIPKLQKLKLEGEREYQSGPATGEVRVYTVVAIARSDHFW